MSNKEIKFDRPEFEHSVRYSLDNYDQPITEGDLRNIRCFYAEDIRLTEEEFKQIPGLFKNLELLSVPYGYVAKDPDALTSLDKLVELEVEGGGDLVDFSVFKRLKQLERLWVSGGFYAPNLRLENVEVLTTFENLVTLSLHEFGSVDLKFLEDMRKLEAFFCGYASDVKNVESIGKLKNLKSLELVGIPMDNIDFFDMLDENVEIDLCGVKIKEEVNLSRLERFKVMHIEDIYMQGRFMGGEYPYS